jgi:hypothetical protein
MIYDSVGRLEAKTHNPPNQRLAVKFSSKLSEQLLGRFGLLGYRLAYPWPRISMIWSLFL